MPKRSGSTVAAMMKRATAPIVAAGLLLMATITAGCAQDEPPAQDEPAAICSAVDSLKASVEDVTNVDLDQGAMADLRDNLNQVQSDLGKVKDDAKDEYATEIDAVEQAAASVGSSVEAATTSPSAQAITDVGTAVQALGASLRALDDAVESTC
ncbi:hypothetical protein [Cryobacterium sp. BB736]|uniref:hypothetical protein n=1 Tax=Cryobacterium sp. BB736 TaxID=2746963 RepID=UPI0018760D85|nr:hypothetical protein [Cryobacterium sp. BB736]